jgi:hypothetical protein
MTTVEPHDEKATGGSFGPAELAQVAPQARRLFEALASQRGASDPALLAQCTGWVGATRSSLRAADQELTVLVTASHHPMSPSGGDGGAP